MRKSVFTPAFLSTDMQEAERQGFTLLEIIIAAIIIAVLMWGLTNLFVSGRRHIMHARLRMAGSELGKYFLDPLQRDVRQDQWQANTNCLTSDGDENTCGPTGNQACCDTTPRTDPYSQIVYTPEYQITPLAVDTENPLGHLRKVILRLSWREHNIATNP
jgi:prepilin-type N-terminal cleavage/methylation domain-containing protein